MPSIEQLKEIAVPLEHDPSKCARITRGNFYCTCKLDERVEAQIADLRKHWDLVIAELEAAARYIYTFETTGDGLDAYDQYYEARKAREDA